MRHKRRDRSQKDIITILPALRGCTPVNAYYSSVLQPNRLYTYIYCTVYRVHKRQENHSDFYLYCHMRCVCKTPGGMMYIMQRRETRQSWSSPLCVSLYTLRSYKAFKKRKILLNLWINSVVNCKKRITTEREKWTHIISNLAISFSFGPFIFWTLSFTFF
jgi:hypothetical protein